MQTKPRFAAECYMSHMQPKLTVAIPTFNRAALLDRQLAWFARAAVGQEHLVELLVSDNCSPDETPEVTARWARTMAGMGLEAKFTRNDENIGAIRNIASCIDRARGRYVWTVGDDDTINPDALRFVIDTIDANPDLALLILNFSSRHVKTGNVNYERCFEIADDLVEANGKDLFERFMGDPRPSRWGGLVLTTALVYQAEVAREALRAWPEGVHNIGLQVFVTAWCAQHGQTILTRDAHLEMASGRHFFAEDRMVFFRFRIADLPEAFVKVAGLSYSKALLREKIRNQRREISWRRVLRLFAHDPRATVGVLWRHLVASRAL